MRRKPDWPSIIENWRQSGLSKSVYCKQQGICQSNFHKNYKDLSSKKAVNSEADPQACLSSPHFVQMIGVDASEANMQVKNEVIQRYLRIRTPSGCELEIPL